MQYLAVRFKFEVTNYSMVAQTVENHRDSEN
jgi:hypothetical protein